MFLSIILIAIGLAILLNTLGWLSGSFWGFFWAIVFIAVGCKLMMKSGKCPVCGWSHWGGKMHGKIHEKMHDHCDCGCECNQAEAEEEQN